MTSPAVHCPGGIDEALAQRGVSHTMQAAASPSPAEQRCRPFKGLGICEEVKLDMV